MDFLRTVLIVLCTYIGVLAFPYARRLPNSYRRRPVITSLLVCCTGWLIGTSQPFNNNSTFWDKYPGTEILMQGAEMGTRKHHGEIRRTANGRATMYIGLSAIKLIVTAGHIHSAMSRHPLPRQGRHHAVHAASGSNHFVTRDIEG
jgi:hypothetical protein